MFLIGEWGHNMAEAHRKWSGPRAFLGALLRDARANTLAIMALALIPLAGLVGGGVDISRMYIVKTRLQHACDAGALAGRKSMGGGTWAYNSYAPRTAAEQFFDANIQASPYGATGLTRSFTESAGKVSGTASATVPMTLMSIFGRTSETLSVTCDAEMRLPNTDVMFVLDTTKSMMCAPSATSNFCSDAGSGSRIVGLRTAVKCFYEIVARLDTDATCTGGTPSGGTGNQVQIRFGFVPYATNVNVGRLLPNSYMVDSWNYQTRQANMAVPPQAVSTYWETYGGGSTTQSDCLKFMSNTAFTGFTPTATSSGGPNPNPTVATTFPSDGVATDGTSTGEWGWTGASDTSGTTKSCRRKRTDTTTYYVPKFASWTYNSLPVTVSGLKAGGSSWNASFAWPVGDTAVGNDVTSSTITWDGCIEERETTDPTTDFTPIPSDAYDLDIDLVPYNDATRWKPALPRLIFTRHQTSGGSNYNATSWSGSTTSSWSAAAETVSTDYSNGSSYACPTEARKLQAWPDATAFDDYVDTLTPDGATYHDIGILWGARLMSPTGIFSSENATTPQGGEIMRHMIFMTDGDTNANDYDYAAYGLPWFDHRETAANPSKADLDEQVNERFLALCTAVKNKNITLWVISFGASIASDSATRLQTCATTGRYFTAADSATLQTTFMSIANQISQLRLTK
jgi:Flp pilus assembly protein TadG